MTSMTFRDEQDDEGYLKASDVCKILQITDRTLIRWDQAGRTVPLRLPNGYRRYRRQDIVALLSEQAS
jgi:DNA-binding transcriptional MerR regulator